MITIIKKQSGMYLVKCFDCKKESWRYKGRLQSNCICNNGAKLKKEEIKNRLNECFLEANFIGNKKYSLTCKYCSKIGIRPSTQLHRKCICRHQLDESVIVQRLDSNWSLQNINKEDRKAEIKCKRCGTIAYKTFARLDVSCRCVSFFLKNKDNILSRLNKSFAITKHVYKKGYLIKCLNCNNEKVKKLNDLKYGCSICGNGTIKAEKEFRDWIMSLGFSADKYRLKNKKEIDIFIEEKNLGIEYNGLYWHSEEVLRISRINPRMYHYDKMIAAKEEGIRLLTVFEDEWLLRNEQVKGFICSILGINTIKIGARKCSMAEIEWDECNNFLQANHIQGKGIKPIISIGLKFKDELIAVVCLGRHHRGGSPLVLSRLCFKIGVSVPGGASRLLKESIAFANKNSYKKIISWSDNRWSEGNIYIKLGFVLDKNLTPDYNYTKGARERFSKQSLKLKKNEKELNKTEKELRESQGYLRIWDCGKIRWAMEVK